MRGAPILVFTLIALCYFPHCSSPTKQDNSVDTLVVIMPDTAEVPTQGLLAWYPLNGNAADSSGNENDGTLVGPTPTVDRFGAADGALSFDGQDDHVTTPLTGVLGDSARTISVWARVDSLGSTARDIVCYGTMAQGGSFKCRLVESSLMTGVQIDMNNAAITYSAQIEDGRWHHYAWVLPPVASPAIDDVRVYRDGVLLSSASNVRNAGTQVSTMADQPVVVGATLGVSQTYFPGDIDDLRIYNRALSGREIAALLDEGGWPGP